MELAQEEGRDWRVTADWVSKLRADFDAYLTTEEVADFAAQMLSHLSVPGRRFSAAVTAGRNNPLTLRAQPVEDGYAFFVRLTPNGDDDVCHLQMEIDPIDVDELRGMFDALHASSAV
ncbi:hypothetical protein [Streptomyces smaragdinus]|uniref:hypothetical protein n=1 Tax=Streptomyces smaragdinus TaxID=2585196 RepID=UPI001296F509|nr:hypothetical protein [Streptomyces smaragdinus]